MSTSTLTGRQKAQMTSKNGAPVASQSAEMELMEEMRCASIALAVSLESSADQRLDVSTCSRGTQFAYTSTSICTRQVLVAKAYLKIPEI